MKLSQLLYVMDRENTVQIYDYRSKEPTIEKPLFIGRVRDIKKDNEINHSHVKYILPVRDRLIIEIS